jgi:hypothetical protein
MSNKIVHNSTYSTYPEVIELFLKGKLNNFSDTSLSSFDNLDDKDIDNFAWPPPSAFPKKDNNTFDNLDDKDIDNFSWPPPSAFPKN